MKTNLETITELIDGKTVVGSGDNSMDIISVFSTDLMSDVLRCSARGSLLVTALNQPQVIRTAEIADIPAVVIVHNKKIDREMIDLAEKKNIAIISTHLPMFTVCGILYTEGPKSCQED